MPWIKHLPFAENTPDADRDQEPSLPNCNQKEYNKGVHYPMAA